jgi:hypothetical protein
MASGHVNRANRPNTWLHRPSCKREESPCQRGAVHTGHKADMQAPPVNVRFQANSRNGAKSAFVPRRTSHGQRQTSGSGGADFGFPVAAHPLRPHVIGR